MMRRALRAVLAAGTKLGLTEKEGSRPDASRSRLRHLAVADVFGREVPERSANILDVGCGQGALSRELQERGYLRLSGCDWLPCEALTAKARDFNYAQVDINATGLAHYADSSFDAVVCSDVIEHLENPAKALAEIARVLRTGGKAVVSVPNAFNLMERLSWALSGNSTRYKQEASTSEFGHIAVLPSHVMQSLAARAGLLIAARSGGYSYLDGFFILPKKRLSLLMSYNEILVMVKT